jgi:predicted Fe-Mo cluster-binding NifX family protein
MTVLITAQGPDWEDRVDPRFGRAAYFFCVDDATEEVSVVSNSSSAAQAHGAGTKAAAAAAELQPDVLITGNGPGQNAGAVLGRTELQIFVGAGGMTIREAFDAWKAGKLTKF